MDIDAGFDRIPHLSMGAVDRHNWDKFINFGKEYYKNDDLIRVSIRWTTAMEMVPKGLDVGGFEKWLWRQGN